MVWDIIPLQSRTTKRTVNRMKSPATGDAVHPRVTRVSKGTAGASKATAVRKGMTRAEMVASSDKDSELLNLPEED